MRGDLDFTFPSWSDLKPCDVATLDICAVAAETTLKKVLEDQHLNIQHCNPDKTYLWMTMAHMRNAIEAVKIFVTFFIKNILFRCFGNFHILETFSCTFIPVKRQIFPIVTRWTRRHGFVVQCETFTVIITWTLIQKRLCKQERREVCAARLGDQTGSPVKWECTFIASLDLLFRDKFSVHKGFVGLWQWFCPTPHGL